MKRAAFTLVELLTAMAVVAVLATLAMSTVGIVRSTGQYALCANSLRQLGVATQLYLSDHSQTFFNYSENTTDGKLWYFGLEPWGSVGGPEGSRTLDETKGPLYPYIMQVGGIVVCPAFPYNEAIWKPKFKGASYGYGYNTFLSGRKVANLGSLSQVLLFGDCAQVNTFQAPASAKNPMIEEFYMIENQYQTVHFRHGNAANILFLDGHVEKFVPFPGTVDTRLPTANVGRITPKGSMQYLQ